MAIYGSYETVAEIGRTRATTVFKARPADGGWDLGFAGLGSDTHFAIKVVRARSAQDAGEEEPARFIDRARDQKRVASTEGNTHWAKVLEAGEQRGETWCVMELLDSSVDRLLASHRTIDPDTLWAIITGTLQGLLEIKHTLGRPHGNLKPSNVLLRKTKSIDTPDIVLSDPAAESDATIAGEVEDLYNLGELIHQLVLGYPFPGQHTWPVQSSAPWQTLGPTGRGWLQLCNRLLSPRAAEQWLRFDDILEEVAGLHPPRPRFKPRRMLARLAVPLILVGLGVGEWFRYTYLWRNLCGSYERWAGNVADQLSAQTPAPISSDPYLRDNFTGVFARAASGQADLDPRKIAASSQSLAELAKQPPLSLGAIWKTERANWLLSGVEKDLSLSKWPALREVSQKHDRYRDSGYAKLTEYTQRLIDDVSVPPDQRSRWPEAIARVVEGQRALARLDAARQSAAQRLARLSARMDTTAEIRPRIEVFANLVRLASRADITSPTGNAVDTLARQVEDAEQVGAKFESMVPLLADAQRRQRAYEVRGWKSPALYLGSLIDSVTPASDTELIRIETELAAGRKYWEEIEKQWSKIEARRRTLDASGDRILMSYRQYVQNSGIADQTSLSALLHRLEEINDHPSWAAAAKKVSAPEWGNFDVIAFAQRSQAHRDFIGRFVATDEDLKKWLAEVEGHGTLLASATMQPDNVPSSVKPTTVPSTLPTTIASVQPSNTVVPPSTQPSPTTHPATNRSDTNPTTVAATKPSPTTIATANPATRTSPIAVAMVPPATLPSAWPELKAPPDPEKIRLETEIANFIIECREIGINATNRDIKQAWRDGCTRLAGEVTRTPVVYSSAKAQRQRLRGRLLQLDGAWRTAAAPLKLDGDAAWQAEFARALEAHAADTLSTAAHELIGLALADAANFEPRLEALVDSDEQWRGKAMKLAGDVRQVASGLAAGYTPAEKTAEGATIASRITAIRSSDLLSIEPVGKALEPVLAPVAQVESTKDGAELRKIASSEPSALGLRLFAWSKLGSSITRDGFESDLKLAPVLLAAATSAKLDAARLETIKTSLESAVRTRWTALLESSKDPLDVELAISTRDQIRGVDFDQLSPRSRFNLALFELRGVAAGASDEELPKRMAPAIARLREATTAVGDSNISPSARTLLDALQTFEHPQVIDPAEIGPMSADARNASGGRIDWTARAENDGELIIYRTTIDGPGHGKETVSLAFRRVQTSASAPASYVLTTEMPMGVLDDLATAAGKWSDLRSQKLLPPYDPLRGDPRPGPRVWEWPRFGRTPGITRSLIWLSGDFLPAGSDHYPETIGSEFNRTVIRDPSGQPSSDLNPSRRQPMQYISARGAQSVAVLAGCRLPTVAEWRSAYKVAGMIAGANLRDRTWRLQLEHMQRPPIAGKARPDAGMFVPAGEKPSDNVWKTDAGQEHNDGVLFFRPVPADPPGRFIDLPGNVCEFVTDGSGKLCVIGASALSPPERPIDQAFPLAEEQLTSGFSDVGFRLAFSIAPKSIAPVKDAVAGKWYLTK